MKLRKLIAVLAAILMVVSMMPLSVFAEMGGDFPWTDTSEKMLVEEILERDGLIDGVWFPWFDGGRCGHNLTGNDLYAKYYNAPKDSSKFVDWNAVELDRLGADKIYRQIYNLKAMGYNMMAYAGSIYAEGVMFDDNGDVIGIKEEYLTNARRLLDMCREIGMPVMWNVYFHSSTTATYYGIDGWKVICQMLGNPEVADHYADRFVRPLCQMLAEYPDVVALVSIADEAENEINDDGTGEHYGNDRGMYGVNQDDMVYFMQQINEVVRQELPGVARTVASNGYNKAIYRDFNLDLMGHHEYNNHASVRSVEKLITDANAILTEFNVGGDVFFSDDELTQKLITFRKHMMAEGYKGGFQWCWLPGGIGVDGSSGSWGGYLLREEKDPTSFRKTVTDLRYYMEEYRAKHQGKTITLDTPVLYANAGDGRVLFSPSKRAEWITIQRSDDGGNTWITLVANANQADYVDQYLIGTYEDATAPESGYCYRIIATDANGNSVTSQPNNVAGADTAYRQTYVAPTYQLGEYYRLPTVSEAGAKLTSFFVAKNRPFAQAQNLIQNGGFESADGQWNTDSFLQYGSVVEDATTPDGDKSLYFNTSDKSQAGWYTFTVSGLKKNTDYTFSSFLKGAYLADDNKGMASLGVVDPDTGNFMVYWEFYRNSQRASQDTQQLYPTAWDDEWHLRAVSFNSGERTTVTIALYGYASKMWVDGLALFESANGIKYENGESTSSLTSDKWEDLSDSATNAVEDPQVNDATYWSNGAGYKQGFVQAASGALQYVNSADPCGVRYTKWIDVKPGTDYYYSFTVNVTSAGNGRVAILDNSKLLPNEVVAASFSSTGTKTYRGCISTGMYDQLGLGVVDLGGIATIDNISFYEAGESTVIPTDPSFDGYIINGDFEVGNLNGWTNLWDSNVISFTEGHNSLFAMQVSANQWQIVRQEVPVEPNTDYIVEVWSKSCHNASLLVKDSTDLINLAQGNLNTSSSWTKTQVEFNSGDNTFVYVGMMGATDNASYIVDDVKMRKKTVISNDGFIVNGDFEIGSSTPWENVWGSNTVTIVNGHNSNYGMKVNAGQYTVVRETVAVKANTDYIIEYWSKDCYDACLLIKDNADSVNIVDQALPAGSAWMHSIVEFNTGNNTSIYVGFMGGSDGSYYTVDDITMYGKTDASPEGLFNGGFEYGEEGWSFNAGSHAIVNDAHSGNNALQLQNPPQWGEAAVQTFAVEPYTNYTVTWWYKAAPNTGVFNLIAMNSSGNMEVLSGNNFMNTYNGAWQQRTYRVNTGDSSTMMLKFTTEALEPGTILIDDIAITEVVCDHDYYLTDYLEPTCVNDGVEIYTCYFCYHSYTEIIPATGEHTYYSTVTKAATCGTTGLRTYTCYDCGYSYNETIPATGYHSYDHACDAYCNACNAYRYVSHSYSGACDAYCNICGYTRTVYTSHTYDDDCDATCNVCDHYRVVSHYFPYPCSRQCALCGDDNYAAVDHQSNTTPCEDGECVVCGAFLPSAGHRYSADCDTTCNVCDYVRSDAVIKNGDFELGWQEWSCWKELEESHRIVTDAHSGNYALQLSELKQYDEAAAQIIEVLPDTVYTITWWYKAAPGTKVFNLFVMNTDGYANLTSFGGQSYMNTLTGDWQQMTYTVNTGSATSIMLKISTDASFNDGTILIDDMSISNDALIEHEYNYGCDKVCYVCGELTRPEAEHVYEAPCSLRCRYCEAERTDSVEHDFTVDIIEPTCQDEGYRIYRCRQCGYEYEDILPAAGHTYDSDCDADCNVCGEERYGETTLNFADISYRVAYSSTYQEWAFGSLRLRNDKAGSTSSVGGYYNPVRIYKNSTVTISYPGMTKLVLNAYDSASYLNYLTTSLKNAGLTYTQNGAEFTITFDQPTDSITLTAAGQFRLYSIIATAERNHVYDNDCDATCNACGAVRDADHAYNGVVTAPDCENGGYTTYTCQNCGDSYKANYTEAVGHNYVGEQTTAPTCAAVGVMTYTCSACGDSYTEEIAVTNEHTYDHALDAACNVCGAVREVDCSIAYLGASVSENVHGLAMLFQADAEGIAVKSSTILEADFTNATYKGYQLLGLGAMVTNGIETITIKGHFLYDMADDYTRFAFRLVNIPADKLDVAITMAPYYAIEIDGVETMIYCEPQTKTYNEANR